MKKQKQDHSTKKHRTTITFEERQWERLKAYADSKGLTISRAITEILDTYFDFIDRI